MRHPAVHSGGMREATATAFVTEADGFIGTRRYLSDPIQNPGRSIGYHFRYPTLQRALEHALGTLHE